jgi:hypothetical protein
MYAPFLFLWVTRNMVSALVSKLPHPPPNGDLILLYRPSSDKARGSCGGCGDSCLKKQTQQGEWETAPISFWSLCCGRCDGKLCCLGCKRPKYVSQNYFFAWTLQILNASFDLRNKTPLETTWMKPRFGEPDIQDLPAKITAFIFTTKLSFQK